MLPSQAIRGAFVWIEDGVKKLYLSTEYSDGSSIYSGKSSGGISEGLFVEVPCFDLSRWIRDSFELTDEIILKLDVEGAEYAILDKLIRDGTIKYVNILCGELHDMKIESGEFQSAADFVRGWLERNDRRFDRWEAHEVRTGIVERPPDMREVAGWKWPEA